MRALGLLVLAASIEAAPRLALDRSKEDGRRTATIAFRDFAVGDFDADERALEGEGPTTTLALRVSGGAVVGGENNASYQLTASLADVNAALGPGVGVRLATTRQAAATAIARRPRGARFSCSVVASCG